MRLTVGMHPVREALRAHRALDKVLISKGAGGPRIQEIIDLCRDQSVPVRFEAREALDRASKGAAHQGVIAFGAAHDYVQLDSIFENAQMLVILDGVEDPHNLGARAAAGALEYLPVARVTNISQTLERLKQHGFWIYGLDERGTESYNSVDFTIPSAIVLGGEGKGLHQGVRKQCDFLVRIPMAGQVSSLNVSVAAGIILFEWRRRHA
jgi:23S rRNA (guanosine2251-2'-O)-methyltransferase